MEAVDAKARQPFMWTAPRQRYGTGGNADHALSLPLDRTHDRTAHIKVLWTHRLSSNLDLQQIHVFNHFAWQPVSRE